MYTTPQAEIKQALKILFEQDDYTVMFFLDLFLVVWAEL